MDRAATKIPAEQPGLTIEEFLDFTESRPKEERWELIEGEPVLNPSPVQMHQMIAVNISSSLLLEKGRLGASWLPILGIGTRVPASPKSLPQPDVYVQAHGIAENSHITDDALVVFEVLSRSNNKADREWRRQAYASIPNCQHYVTVALTSARVVAFDRSTGWRERTIAGLKATLNLPALGARLRLADIYRWTPLGERLTRPARKAREARSRK